MPATVEKRAVIAAALLTSLFLIRPLRADEAPLLLAEETQGTDAMPPADLAKVRANFVKKFQRTALNTTPGDAMFLRIMVESTGAKRGVEVGTASGYGAIVMGFAFERNGGHLTTIDIDPKAVKTARANIEKMRLGEVVDVVQGNALEELAKLKGKLDFAFIDAVKRDYLKYFKLIEPRLKPGAVVVADNVIQSAGDMQDFLDTVGKDPNYHMVIIRASEEKHDGMAVIYKVK